MQVKNKKKYLELVALKEMVSLLSVGGMLLSEPELCDAILFPPCSHLTTRIASPTAITLLGPSTMVTSELLGDGGG